MMVGETDYWFFILYATVAIVVVVGLRIAGNIQDRKEQKTQKPKG